MERHIIFTKHLDEFNTEQDIIDAKDMIKFEVRAIIESEEQFYLTQLLDLAIEYGEYRLISYDTFNELNESW